MVNNLYFLLFFYCLKCSLTVTKTAPIPIQLENPEQIARMKFHLQLPTNDTVQIKLSFKLLTPSKTLPVFYGSEHIDQLDEKTNLTETSNETTQLAVVNITSLENLSTTSEPEAMTQLVTVEEAIESFRKSLIQKEMEIAGIIESQQPFYRHFRLEYGDGIELPIRCTYDANFQERLLVISCYQYVETGSQRVLSNGEFETSPLSYTPEYIDAKNVKQTYSMKII